MTGTTSDECRNNASGMESLCVDFTWDENSVAVMTVTTSECETFGRGCVFVVVFVVMVESKMLTWLS